MERGTSELVRPGLHEPAVGDAETGIIFAGELGSRFAAGDDSLRLVLWVSGKLLHERLQVLLDGREVKSFAFRPAFDQMRGPGATIRRMLDFLFVELERSDSLLANEIATRTFEDNLALCLLLGLPHSHTERLHQKKLRRTRACSQGRAIHARQCRRAADDRRHCAGCGMQRPRSADGV